VVDLSFEDEAIVPNASRDVEFTKRLFSDLNHDLLRPLSDGKVIVLSDSDDEDEVREETTVDIDAVPSSIVRSLAPTDEDILFMDTYTSSWSDTKISFKYGKPVLMFFLQLF
jgi:hypothetical protein